MGEDRRGAVATRCQHSEWVFATLAADAVYVHYCCDEGTPGGPSQSTGVGRCEANVGGHFVNQGTDPSQLPPFSLKSAGPSRQEHARLEVENAEDDLVQKTEVAITLMKTVLENVCGVDLPANCTLNNIYSSPSPSRTLMNSQRLRYRFSS